MSYIPSLSTSSIVYAVLTRKGKEMMGSNDQMFAPSQFAVGDDEINYQLMTLNDTIDTDDPNIIALPIPEPSTNENSELIHKIWVNNSFLDQQFQGQAPTQSQRVIISSDSGNIITLYSNDSAQTQQAWVATLNPINKPYIDLYYRFLFQNQFDFFKIDFINPPLTDSINKNFTVVNPNVEYIFQAKYTDGSGQYTATNSGSPAIVFKISLVETPMLFTELQKPENSNQILIPNFLTVYDIDQGKTTIPDIQTATISCQVLNVLG